MVDRHIGHPCNDEYPSTNKLSIQIDRGYRYYLVFEGDTKSRIIHIEFQIVACFAVDDS